MKFDKESCIPLASEWIANIELNKTRLLKFNELRSQIKIKLFEEAKKFTESLGINIEGKGVPDAVVMSGHQPEIYHHGILFKNYVLQKFSKDNNTLGINLIIDTDEGGAGTLVFPTYLGKIPGKKKLPIGNQTKPYFSQNLPPVLPDSEYLKDYTGLEGRSVVEAHTIVRRKYEKACNYLELPFSRVLGISEVQNFISGIIKDGNNFAKVYNETLNSYRNEEKIKNKANPFPDLKISDSETELPFWNINTRDNSRVPYILGSALKDSFIAPKAAIITIIARLLLCDLFIHGTGGAKYDKFTDKFIKNYYQIEPPSIVVASADRYFFKEEIIRYEKEKEAAEKRRRLLFHPDKHLEELSLSQDLKTKVIKLSEEKSQNIEKIKSGKAERVSTAGFTQEIKRIESEIRDIISSVLGPDEKFVEPPKVFLETIYSRDFSYLVFND